MPSSVLSHLSCPVLTLVCYFRILGLEIALSWFLLSFTELYMLEWLELLGTKDMIPAPWILNLSYTELLFMTWISCYKFSRASPSCSLFAHLLFNKHLPNVCWKAISPSFWYSFQSQYQIDQFSNCVRLIFGYLWAFAIVVVY